ncbi:MAG: iron-sulfur cluster assembly scaffold protein [Patescibacteria group bacterium]
MSDLSSLYQEAILEEANQPRNFGELPNAQISSTKGNISCGDKVTVQINLDQDNKTVSELKWQGEGCVITRAAMSVVSELVIGLDKESIAKLEKEQILAKLGLPAISPGRLRCLMLGLEVVKKALEL